MRFRRLVTGAALFLALTAGLAGLSSGFGGNGALWFVPRGDFYLTDRDGNATGLAAVYQGITNAGNDGYIQVGPGLESLDLTGLPVGASIMRTTYAGIDFLGRPLRVYDGQLVQRLQVDSLGAAVTGALTVSTTANVTGNTTLGGKALVTDSLRVGRITTLNGGLTVQGAGVTFTNPLTFTTAAGNGVSFNGATGGASVVNASSSALMLGGRNNSTTLTLNQVGASDANVNGYLIVSDSLRANKGIYIGGQIINKVLRASATIDFDLSAVNSQDATVTVTGAVTGDEVILGVPNGAITTDILYFAWVSSNDTVAIRAYDGAAAGNPASGTFKVTVLK